MKKIMLSYNESNQLEVKIHPKDFSRTGGLGAVLIKKDSDEIHTVTLFMSKFDVEKSKELLRQEPKMVARVMEMNDERFIYSDNVSEVNTRLLLDKVIEDLNTI